MEHGNAPRCRITHCTFSHVLPALAEVEMEFCRRPTNVTSRYAPLSKGRNPDTIAVPSTSAPALITVETFDQRVARIFHEQALPQPMSEDTEQRTNHNAVTCSSAPETNKTGAAEPG